jgi:hypothetical protein
MEQRKNLTGYWMALPLNLFLFFYGISGIIKAIQMDNSTKLITSIISSLIFLTFILIAFAKIYNEKKII